MEESFTPAQTQPDAALVSAAQLDTAAFAALYEKYAEPIYRYIYFRVGRSAETAEDLTADVFVKALRSLPQYKDQGHPYSAYLYRIARTTCIDFYRSHASTPTVELAETVVAAPGDLVIQADVALLWQKLEQYDSTTVEIFQLRYLEQLPFETIAEIVGKKPGALRTLVSRTINQLQQSYEA